MNIYIDAENVSYKEFDTIKNYYVNDSYKILSLKVYGDWHRLDMQKWYELCKKYSIDQKQCINQPKKGVVDFNIVIDIMDDVYNDMISKNNVIRKILVVSSDSDFIHIHNRIVKTGIDIEIFSPISFHNSKYKIHDTLFISSSSITIDNNNTTNTTVSPEQPENYPINSSYENSHSYFEDTDEDDEDDKEDEEDEDMFENNLSDEYSEISEDDDDDNSEEYNTYEDDDDYYNSLCSEESVNKMKQNIGICFKWINKKENPTKPVNEQKFKNTYKLLESNNMFDKILNVDHIFEYLSHFQLIEYIVVDNFRKIKVNYPITNDISKINELTMCYRYQNKENIPVLFSTFLCNICLLKDKNIIKFKCGNKHKLKQLFSTNKISGFVLLESEKKRNKKVKKMLYVKKL